MDNFYTFILNFQQNLLTVPAIVFFVTIAVTVQQNKGAQDRLVAGLIGALAPVAYYERKNIKRNTTKALEGLAGALSEDAQRTEKARDAEEAENEEDPVPNKS